MDESEVISALKFHGGRLTKPRRAIIRALLDSQEHITAEELAAIVKLVNPEIHLSTVYRNLEELEKIGIVVHTHLLHGPATYHLEGQLHIHLICEGCGKIIESPIELFNQLSRDLKRNFGFTINLHHFALSGKCKDCQ